MILTVKSSMHKQTLLQPLKNQAHPNQLLFQTLLTTLTTRYRNLLYKKSGSTKFSKEFQKFGMRWLSWNKKFNSVLLLILLPNKKASPSWTYRKNWVSKTLSIAEVYSWTTSKYVEIKTWPKLKESWPKKWTWG